MQNLAKEILLTQLKAAHSVLEGTLDGVTDEVLRFVPPGTANPIAGTYAHIVFSEDLFVQSFLKGEKPLMETDFKDKTGASALQPTEWEKEFPRWIKEVQLDMGKFHLYAKAVFLESEKYVSTLTDNDLQKEVDMSAFGMGSKKAYDFIANLISGHTYSIAGEIAVLKGIQGLKGYPF